MKKYIYTKESESVIVETDGLGRIDNFMVTGVIGRNYSGLVQSGFFFKMGDAVSIASMLNMAKLCKAKVECFEGDVLVQDESADYVENEPELDGTIEGLSLAIVKDKATYEANMFPEYVEAHPYEEGLTNNNFPWLVARFKKQTEKPDSTYQVQVLADDRVLDFVGTSANLGEISEDMKTLTCKAKNGLSWEVVADLGIVEPKNVTWFTIRITYSGVLYEAKLNVTPDTI